jgi:hypothetical protein
VFCTGDRGEKRNQRYADETCSPDLSDCELADPDGPGSSSYSQVDDGKGDGYSGLDVADQSNNVGTSSGTTPGGRNGGDGYIGVI